ncbi:hypothetical protein SPRA44_140007 [Serratia proteamaculans]|uniref:hypothetical protein n=1 Tax=Serratia proteamaculans TaxID=28151 RepID=UPI0009F7B6AC|nr:hypothetical protein [Serratia proteamaculans]SMB24971.1 hypothetical protein SPRA44_140007 [Serratia proteamaculans]
MSNRSTEDVSIQLQMKMIITLIIIFMNIEQPVHAANLPDGMESSEAEISGKNYQLLVPIPAINHLYLN